MSKARRVFEKLVENYKFWSMLSSNPKSAKPGQAILELPEKDREALRELKPEETQDRPLF